MHYRYMIIRILKKETCNFGTAQQGEHKDLVHKTICRGKLTPLVRMMHVRVACVSVRCWIRSIVRRSYAYGQRRSAHQSPVRHCTTGTLVIDPLRTSRMVDVHRSIGAMPRVAGVGAVSKSDGYPSENETSVYDRLVQCTLC
jgi:hypothetical protein